MEPRKTAYGAILAAAESAGIAHRPLTMTRALRLVAPDGHVLVVDFDRAGRAIGARRRDPELAAGHAVRTLPSDDLRDRALAWIGLHAGPRPAIVDDQFAAYSDGRVERLAPASAPDRGSDAFDEIDRSDAAAADFERSRFRTGYGDSRVGPTWRDVGTLPGDGGDSGAAQRQEPVYGVHAAPGLMSVDVHGPAGQPVFELGRWDADETAHVHLASLNGMEAADLYRALAHALGVEARQV
jgi:hypothetical protein